MALNGTEEVPVYGGSGPLATDLVARTTTQQIADDGGSAEVPVFEGSGPLAQPTGRATLTVIAAGGTAEVPLYDGSGPLAAPSIIRRATAEEIKALAGGGSYHADAVHFDGSTWLAISSLTSVTDSPFISSSHWVSLPAYNAGYLLYDFDPAGNEAPALSIGNNGQILFFTYNGSQYFGWASDDIGVIPADSTWHNILVAIDTNHLSGAKIAQVYVDDVIVTGSWTTDHASTCTALMAGLKFAVPDTTEDTLVYIGDMADVWVAPDAFLDFSVEANRRKFISASGKPVNPSGFPASAVLFSGNASTFGINQGTGGAFTLTGTLTNAGTSPSD